MTTPESRASSAGSSKKRFKRKLSPFLANEMLYDYVNGRLDRERERAVAEYLESESEGRTHLAAINDGLRYTEKLSRTQLSEETMSSLRDAESAVSLGKRLGKRYVSWRAWPDTMRWSLTAIALSSLVAAVVALTPWHKLSLFSERKANIVEIARIPVLSDERIENSPEDGVLLDSGAADEGSGDDIDDAAAAVAAKPGGANGAPKSNEQNQARSEPPHPDLSDASAREASRDSEKPSHLQQASATETEPQPAPEKKEPRPKGFVYRAFMNLPDLDTVGTKIADHIRELGGAKAGEVELGWKRGTGRYYHFSLPATAEEQLLEKLRVYGPVRISKDPHPRVMPEGQVRFILWIESAD